ncbi:restriction endonuclease [Parafrankia sp. FMc2]|uniref:restriction endonuclease n=1 Tax=Parafrankia sp. FMc2 TaxID=3233196 RepID=UPI0034D792E8
MARRRGFVAELQRDAARRRREAEQAQRAAVREATRIDREAQQALRESRRTQAASDRERARQHVQEREADASAQNAHLNLRIAELSTVLSSSLATSPGFPFDVLRQTPNAPAFDPDGLDVPAAPPDWADFEPPPPGAVGRVFGGAGRYERAMAQAEAEYTAACEEHAVLDANRQRRLAERRAQYDRMLAEEKQRVQANNAEVDRMAAAFGAGDPEVVVAYMADVLQSSVYPDGFPHRYRLLYRPDSRDLVIDYELPTTDVIPEQRSFRYVKKTDEITAAARPVRERRDLYRSVVAQIALRTMREVLDGEGVDVVDTVVFNGHVSTVDRATGQEIRPCLVSVSATREEFTGLVLAQVDPTECLRRLNALVSPHPYDLEPVRPVVDFDLSSYRFIEGMDALADLDGRPNLLEMSPTEFEHLVRQLFEAMGMNSWVTQGSRDDGIDAVATNVDPIVGGLCVIQAKKYRHVVGVEAVRALAGVMEDKRATKGIMVTTSWYGKSSWDFVARHGRIELIDSPRLKFLLLEHLDRDVLIPLDRKVPSR